MGITPCHYYQRDSRRAPLAAAVTALFSIAAPSAYATVLVTNCNDAGDGSLRAAVGMAADGDTVDATGLSCSTITLKTGDIVVPQDSLTIKGPGADKLSVSAEYFSGMTTHQYQNRIFTHTGNGTLTLQYLTATKGYLVDATGSAKGGGVYSKAALVLDHANVTFNTAHTDSGVAEGGGVYAKKSLKLIHSDVSFNIADGGAGGVSLGGGARTAGGTDVSYSRITNNQAIDNTHSQGFYGGMVAFGPSFIGQSVISNNSADKSVGGLGLSAGIGAVTLVNSTISGNKAENGGFGGIYAAAPSIQIYNSTIAFNTAALASGQESPGAQLYAFGGSIRLESSIFANNSYGISAIQNDLSINGVTATGSNNLVLASVAALPADTIIGKCPLLGPLALNGGLTETHRLLSHSPAIDAGNNVALSGFDQRGSMLENGAMDYVRVSGPPGSATPRADIGAYEVQQNDEIYNADFEGCH